MCATIFKFFIYVLLLRLLLFHLQQFSFGCQAVALLSENTVILKKLRLKTHGKELQAHEIFNQETAHGKQCWKALNTRVNEHVSLKVKSNWKTSNFISHRTFESGPITRTASHSMIICFRTIQSLYF